MNTIKTLALATITIGMASCASTQRSQMEGAFGKSTKLTTGFSLQGCCPVAQQLAAETPQGFSPSCGWNKVSL